MEEHRDDSECRTASTESDSIRISGTAEFQHCIGLKTPAAHCMHAKTSNVCMYAQVLGDLKDGGAQGWVYWQVSTPSPARCLDPIDTQNIHVSLGLHMHWCDRWQL